MSCQGSAPISTLGSCFESLSWLPSKTIRYTNKLLCELSKEIGWELVECLLCMNKDRDFTSTIAKTNQPINNNNNSSNKEEEDFEGEETRESILCLMLRRTVKFSVTGQYFVIHSKVQRVWRWLMVKSTGCSPIEPRFGSQDPHGRTQRLQLQFKGI